jgi:hypothetical protein
MVGGTELTNNGQIALSGGTSYVFGDVNNNTSSPTKGINITGNADVTFWDDVTNTGVSLFKVSTGSSATFFGSYSGSGTTGGGDLHFEDDLSPGASPASVTFTNHVTFGPSAITRIELGGTSPGTQYDQLHVNGTLELDGTLQISLINGFTPAAGNSFDILDWSTLSGTLSSLVLPTLPGLAWDTSQLYTTGIISLTSTGIPGDYNQSDSVDAADFVVWRKNHGTTNVLPNDPTGGTIGSTQYNTWRTHFGQTVGSGSSAIGANSAVSEPGGAALVLMAAFFCMFVGRWGARGTLVHGPVGLQWIGIQSSSAFARERRRKLIFGRSMR